MTISYQVLVNEEVGPIHPSRGLHQGDSLSPYLVILCIEGLSSSLKDAEGQGVIHGCRVHRHAPVVSHLLFANDSFLFYGASNLECTTIKSILHDYACLPGRTINFQKSGIFFNPNVAAHLKHAIFNELGVSLPLDTSLYLGLPSLIGKSKKTIFWFIKDHLRHKLRGCRHGFLPHAGKMVSLRLLLKLFNLIV